MILTPKYIILNGTYNLNFHGMFDPILFYSFSKTLIYKSFSQISTLFSNLTKWILILIFLHIARRRAQRQLMTQEQWQAYLARRWSNYQRRMNRSASSTYSDESNLNMLDVTAHLDGMLYTICVATHLLLIITSRILRIYFPIFLICQIKLQSNTWLSNLVSELVK